MLQRVEGLEETDKYTVEKRYMDMHFSNVPCEENGFKGFDYEKLCAMVLYFANRNEKIIKNKINEIAQLFRYDFL